MRVDKGGQEGERDMAADQESGDCDGDFLQQEREQRTEQAEPDRDHEGKPGRGILHEMRCRLKANPEANRGNKEPEKPATEKQDEHANKDADDRDWLIHAITVRNVDRL